MKKLLGLFLLGFLAASAWGCATARTYHIQVNGYTEAAAPFLAPGASFVVIEDQKAQNPLLEKEVKAKIDKLLEKHNFFLRPYDKAQYFLFFTYGMGAPQAVSVAVPNWGIGVGFGTGCWGPGVGYGASWPGYGPYYTETRPLYDRWLRLTVVEGEPYRDTGASRPVWVGEARSTGSSSDLREVLNFLLVAAFEQFGKNTGKAVPAAIKQNDPRLLGLEKTQ
jgi:hypothetical protein